MDKKIIELKEKFRYANKKQLAEIDKEIDELAAKQPTAFSKAMIKASKETVEEINALLLKEKLKNVLPALSVSYFAKTYFKKTPQWFYQRLNGNTVNGKNAKFTQEELKTLSLALSDVGKRINESASFIF
ncbi:DUF5053 domain-containing protein [Parasediminibacterium sp. JCM 36343]|uniref:DUF5053 domain-containing protein n=1 Tax=Parasediminibacterium sp. JCM 36343 TaxID=3374279 RepID=UPI003978DDB7